MTLNRAHQRLPFCSERDNSDMSNRREKTQIKTSNLSDIYLASFLSFHHIVFKFGVGEIYRLDGYIWNQIFRMKFRTESQLSGTFV